MDKQFLCLDSPTDFMVGKYISADELKEFINIPCKIKAGVFYPLHGRANTLNYQYVRIDHLETQCCNAIAQ